MKGRIFFIITAVAITAASSVLAQAPPPPKTEKPPEARQLRRESRQYNRHDTLYLTKEQEEEVIAYLRETRSEQAKRLLELKDRSPERYRSWLSRAFREKRYMDEMKERDPERYQVLVQEKQLESKSRSLASQYRETDNEAEKGQLKSELKTLLDRLFDLRQMNRETEIKNLEKRLDELRENLQQRLDNKPGIVEKRLMEMIGEREKWEW